MNDNARSVAHPTQPYPDTGWPERGGKGRGQAEPTPRQARSRSLQRSPGYHSAAAAQVTFNHHCYSAVHHTYTVCGQYSVLTTYGT